MSPPPDLPSLDSAAKDALILSLIARLDRLEAENARLRERLGLPPKTPDNSGVPPSQGMKPSGGGAREKARRLRQAGAHRPLHPAPDECVDVRAEACGACGTDVAEAAQSLCEAYDRIEIPQIRPHVTRVTLFGGLCPCCGRRFKAKAPAGLEPGSASKVKMGGPNLKAVAIHLRFTQAISFERLSRLMSDLLGLSISEGALVNIMAAAAAPFAAARAAITGKLKAGRVICSDETGLRVGKANRWLWVFHHGPNAVFLGDQSRSKRVVADFLGGHRPDYWVSDRYAGQLGFAAKDNQLCLAHLIRDARYAEDCGDGVFAPGFARLLARACRIGRRRPRLADATLRGYGAKLNASLDTLMALVPASKPGLRFQRVVKKIRSHLFVFLDCREVEPTNNGSEQALRPAVTFRKVTNGFRTSWGATLYADIRSVIETARRRSITALDAIRTTLNGTPLPNPA
jgi:transposase